MTLGKHNGKTFQTIKATHPTYCQWAKRIVEEGTGGTHWKLRQFALWLAAGEVHEEAVPEEDEEPEEEDRGRPRTSRRATAKSNKPQTQQSQAWPLELF